MGSDETILKKDDSLKVKEIEKVRTVDELIERSVPSQRYYLLLVLSSIIIACGILLQNSAIVIGGMVITPLLTPVLAVALGIVVGKITFIEKVSFLILKSILIIILSGFVTALIFFEEPTVSFIFENTMRAAVLYFVVALASGAAATLAWVKQDILEILSGVSIAITLVPPLVLIGIGISTFDSDLVRFYFLTFFLNAIGIITGSMIAFSLLKFYRAGKQVIAK